jgi:hypothetical protein
MTCPKPAKAWMRGDGPRFVKLGRSVGLWRGRTPLRVRQIEVRNDFRDGGADAGAKAFQAGAKTADATSTGLGECANEN